MMLSVFKKRKKFSKENLEYQCGLLSKNIIVNAQNQKVVISTLQQISELMIWGDQNDETFFDVTTENRIFDQLLSIIKQHTTLTSPLKSSKLSLSSYKTYPTHARCTTYFPIITSTN
eukprot:152917_1